MSYPDTLELNSGNAYINFHNDCSKLNNDLTAQMQCDFKGDFSVTINNKKIDEFIKEYNDDFLNGTPLTRIKSRENYILDNILATKLEGTTAEGGASRDYIFIVKNNKSYIISYNQHIDSYVKMLLTFKFID